MALLSLARYSARILADWTSALSLLLSIAGLRIGASIGFFILMRLKKILCERRGISYDGFFYVSVYPQLFRIVVSFGMAFVFACATSRIQSILGCVFTSEVFDVCWVTLLALGAKFGHSTYSPF